MKNNFNFIAEFERKRREEEADRALGGRLQNVSKGLPSTAEGVNEAPSMSKKLLEFLSQPTGRPNEGSSLSFNDSGTNNKESAVAQLEPQHTQTQTEKDDSGSGFLSRLRGFLTQNLRGDNPERDERSLSRVSDMSSVKRELPMGLVFGPTSVGKKVRGTETEEQLAARDPNYLDNVQQHGPEGARAMAGYDPDYFDDGASDALLGDLSTLPFFGMGGAGLSAAGKAPGLLRRLLHDGGGVPHTVGGLLKGAGGAALSHPWLTGLGLAGTGTGAAMLRRGDDGDTAEAEAEAAYLQEQEDLIDDLENGSNRVDRRPRRPERTPRADPRLQEIEELMAQEQGRKEWNPGFIRRALINWGDATAGRPLGTSLQNLREFNEAPTTNFTPRETRAQQIRDQSGQKQDRQELLNQQQLVSTLLEVSVGGGASPQSTDLLNEILGTQFTMQDFQNMNQKQLSQLEAVLNRYRPSDEPDVR